MKKSVFIKQLQNETDCKRKYFKCSLGINKRTGRLQWCPGSKIVRILIIIPATMLPILILFVLFTHLNIVGTTGINLRNHITDTKLVNTESNILDNLEIRDPRCTAVRFGVTETLDAEERELLKDVRTSFIPPDLVLIPPNCKNGNEWISENENEVNIPEEENRANEIIFNHKKARRSITTTEGNNYKSNNTDLDSLEFEQEENEPQVPWKSMSSGTDSNSDHGNAELEEAEIPKPNDYGQYMSSIGYHAFWKGEGTAENIRKTQSEVMKQYMDLTVNPCDDFYQYACGNWEKLNPIPKDKAAYDTFEMLRESLDIVLKELLTGGQNLHVPIVNNSIDSSKSLSDNKTESVPVTTPTPTPHGLTDVQNSLDSRLALRLRKRIIRRRSILNRMITRYQDESRHRRELHYREDADSTDAEIKARNLYESCMNYEHLEKRGITPLLDLLHGLGGWPVLDPHWNEENFDWLNLTAQLRLFNNDIFIVEWVGPDIKNSEENVIQFDQTSLGLPTRDYFLLPTNLQYLDAYKEYMKTIISLLGASDDNATKVANDIIDFEKELAKITSSPEERTNVSILYKRMTVGSLHQQIPQIDWQRYLSVVLEHPINSSEIVVMFAMNYMSDLVKLLSQTESRTISNYLLWRFVRHRVNNLDDRFQGAKQKFYFVLFGREQSPPRWKNCVNQVNANMGMAVGAMFVRKYFDENSKKDTLTMTYELQQAFRELLNTTDWIDSPTKHLAELKVNAMSLRIGYPDYILAREDLNEKYKDLNIDPKKYFENTLNVLLHLTRTEQSKLGQIVNKTAWHTAPAVVNAYYSRNKNQIMFPAGILQPPFYHRHFPKSLNYGGIGVVIGHELTHGFDDKGRLFDRDGNLHRWWSDSAIESFHERARCLIAQYGNYTVSEVGIAVDGENTQGENIADNGGIKQAFRAYQKWVNSHLDEESLKNEILPNLNATNTQLFFLNFAQVWCGAMRPEATRNKLKTAVHSPGKFRVIGTLSNSDDFAREYGCPLGSPMNPQHKCSVW